MASSGSPQIDNLIQQLKSPNIGQKQFAAKTLSTILQSSPQLRPAIEMGLRDNGFFIKTINGGQVIVDAQGNLAGGGATSASGTPNNQWADAGRALGDPGRYINASTGISNANSGGLSGTAQTTVRGGSSDTRDIPGGDNWEADWISGGGGPGGENAVGLPGGSLPGAGDIGGQTDPRYNKSFFGGMPGTALTDMANNADVAGAAWRSQPGVRNTGLEQYGQDDFQALHGLSGFLSGGGIVDPQQQMGFVQDAMDLQSGGGGQYIDPKKLIQQLLQSAGNASTPQAQELILQNLTQNLSPFLGRSQNQMLQAQLGQILDDYTTYGLKGGDLQGNLLSRIQAALGI